MKILVPFIGVALGLGFGLACSRSIQGEDPEYQERIDKFCASACSMSVECGLVEAYDTCFPECSGGKYWWEGDNQCRDSRWAYSDCRAKVTSCEVWGVAAGNGHECDEAFVRMSSDCIEAPSKG